MALYENGKRISGIRDFPAYTWDEYHALPVAQRPKVWKCTDRDYTEIPDLPTGSLTVSGMWSTVQASGKYVATIPLLHADDYTISTGSCATFSGGSAIYTSVTIAEKRTYGLVLTSPTSSIGGCFFELVLNIS